MSRQLADVVFAGEDCLLLGAAVDQTLCSLTVSLTSGSPLGFNPLPFLLRDYCSSRGETLPQSNISILTVRTC